MRFAIMECVVTPGGHEIDFDRILVEELTALGHSVEFYVPEGHQFKWDYGMPVHHLKGTGVSYKGAHGLKKLVLAARREWHRQKWYTQMYALACEDKFDAIIFPSATYRYLRALKRNRLRHSPVPVLFLIHGVTPKEAVNLNHEAEAFVNESNVCIGVQTFAAEKLHLTAKKLRVYGPPNYLPRDIQQADYNKNPEVLKLGFFGQFRREKKLEEFLQAFTACHFTRPVQLLVQGSTQTPEDEVEFNRIIKAYENADNIEFWHHPIIGIEWQKGLASVDVLVMPYGNDRYLYHTSALISNAMGYREPIIAADNVNPEILRDYHIGMSFKNGDMQDLQQTLENFVNTYDAQKATYKQELERAYHDFAPSRLAKNIVALAKE